MFSKRDDLFKENTDFSCITVHTWLRLFVPGFPKDREKAAERLQRQLRCCCCPFAKDRYDHDCYNHVDYFCNTWYRDHTYMKDQGTIDRVNRKVEAMTARCWDKLYNLLDMKLDTEIFKRFREELNENRS